MQYFHFIKKVGDRMNTIKTKKVMYNKSGTGHYSGRISLSKKWLDDMGIVNEDGRNIVSVEYDPKSKQIIISNPNL
jgi:Zn-dependent membrane protease YugP